MVLKRTKNEVRAALASNIMETCRQVLPDIEEIFIEGLLGVTLNKREIFLVNLSDIYSREEAGPPPKRKRGRRSGVNAEYKKEYTLEESFDVEDSPSKRSSGSLPVALFSDASNQHEMDESVQDYSTHYIKEDEMVLPEDYAITKVGRRPKITFPELEDVAMTRKSPLKVPSIPCVQLPKTDMNFIDQRNHFVQPEQPLDIRSDSQVEFFQQASLAEPELQVTQPELQFVQPELQVIQPEFQVSQPELHIPKHEFQSQKQPINLDHPVLDLSVDKRHSYPQSSLPDNMSQSSFPQSCASGVNTIAGLLTGPNRNSIKSENDSSNKSRRKRGRPRKISDDSIKATGPLTHSTNYNLTNNHQPIQLTTNNVQPCPSTSQPISLKLEPNIGIYCDQPQDFSKKSAKGDFSNEVLDLNMNSAVNFNSQEADNTSFRYTSTPEIPHTSNDSNPDSANCYQSTIHPSAIDQSESNSNGQSEAFLQTSQESNQSAESMTSPGQSENSFQCGPVFPHLEEYDQMAFNSSMEDRSLNDSNAEFLGANESQEEEDTDRLELTSTGRPKRKTSMSPWTRQFFNISTGGESKTVQIKATQKCPICNKVFSAGSHLKRHYLVTHTDSSKFQCRICSKRFGSSDHLKRHMGTHASEKKYRCHLCERRFNVKYRLSEHLSERHGIYEISSELNIVNDYDNGAVAMVANEVAMETNQTINHNVVAAN